MHTILKAGLMVNSIFLSSISMATPIDFIDNDSYTTDTISGLDWLDVTASLHLSFGYVSSQFGVGGNYEGWRYATGDEVITMIDNYTGGSNVGNYGVIYQETNKIDGLIELLGSTTDAYALSETGLTWDEYYGYEEGEGRDDTWGLIADQAGSNKRWVARLADIDVLDTDLDFSHVHYTDVYEGTNGPDLQAGSFLVRTAVSAVPEPATGWLFMSAIIGFIGLRRRERNQ